MLYSQHQNAELGLPNLTIKVLVADTHEIVRLGIRTLLAQHSSAGVIAETDNFEYLLQLTSECQPNITLLDPLLRDGNCVERIPELLLANPHSKILIFSNDSEQQTHLHLLRLGVAGIIAKFQSVELIAKAIHAVATGQFWFDRNITQLLLQTQSMPVEPVATVKSKDKLHTLSAREREIASLAAKGLSAKKIGAQLFISEKTVRNNLTLVYEKLGVNGQVELCLRANQLSF